jgi:CHAT domain-containing protein
VAIVLNDLAAVHRSQGEHNRAISLHEKALEINRTIGRSEGAAEALDGIAIAHLERGRYVAADSVLRASIAITDTLIATASGADRRDFLAQEIGRFHKRVLAQVRAGTPEAALRTLEDSRTRVFAERLAGGKTGAEVPPVDSLQRALGPQEAALLYANTDAHGPITAFIVTRTTVRARELPDAAFVRWARRTFEEELDRLQSQEDELLAQAKGVDTDETLASLVRLYRRDLSVPPERQLLATERRRVLGRELYSLLIAPLEDALADAEELVVVPDGALAYLPFETLRDRRNDPLIDRWRVQYTQSLRVLHLLRRRAAQSADTTARKSLLALGGAVYNSETYASDTAASTSGMLADVEPSRALRVGEGTSSAVVRAMNGEEALGASTTRSYRQLGYGPDRWYNLGGTLRETRALGRIVGSSTLLVGANASERTLRELSQSGALDDYRALHFATHGFVVPTAPSLSALVLSEVSRQQPPQKGKRTWRDTTAFSAVDGYLNMREIARLDLRAEFVALSACKTGLGRIYRGSGSVSLAQAFLRAGAGAVAVSLWPVYDASTSRFMQDVYRRAWRYDTTWAEAIAEAKRAFVEGDHGERLRAPRFWAPFVYYGKEAR